MSEREEYHDPHVGDDSESEEVVFREVVEKATSSTVPTAPPEIVTKSDLQEVIEGWKIKFQKLTEGSRAIQIATEEIHTHMDNLMRDNCVRDDAQERRIKQMQEGLARFLERCDPAHPTPVHPFATPCAPTMSKVIISMYRATDQLVFFQIFLRFSNVLWLINCPSTLMIYLALCYLVSENNIAVKRFSCV